MKKLIAALFAAAVALSPVAAGAQSALAEQETLTSAGYRYDDSKTQWVDRAEAPITGERIAELMPEKVADVTAKLMGGEISVDKREAFLAAVKERIAKGEYTLFLSRPEGGRVAVGGRLNKTGAKDAHPGVDAQLMAHLENLSWDGTLQDAVGADGFMPVRDRSSSGRSSGSSSGRSSSSSSHRSSSSSSPSRSSAPSRSAPSRSTPSHSTPSRSTSPSAPSRSSTPSTPARPTPSRPAAAPSKPSTPAATKPAAPSRTENKRGLSNGAKIGAGVAAGAAAGAVIGSQSGKSEQGQNDAHAKPGSPSNPVTHQRTHADGTRERTRKDGTLEHSRPIKGGGTQHDIRKPDGTKIKDVEKGSRREREISKPDGSRYKQEITKGPGKSETRRIEQYNPRTGKTSVTNIKVDRNGNRSVTHADGRTSFRSSDGRHTVRTSPRGNVRTEIRRNGDTTVRTVSRSGYSRNETIRRTGSGRVINRTVIVNNRTVVVNRSYHGRDWYYGGRPYRYYGWYPHYGWYHPVGFGWGWYYSPWVHPVYNPWWGWGWYSYSYWHYYYTPYPVYTAPYLWVTDYLMMDYLAERARERAEARAEARAAAEVSQARLEQDSRKAEITPELKAEIAKEVQEAMKDLEQKKSPELDGAIKPGKPFIVNEEIEANDADGNSCSLSEGDIIRFVSLNTENEQTPMANVKVVKGKKDSCPAGTELIVTIDDIQEMRNDFYAKIDKGVRQADEKKKLGCFDDASKAKSEACQAKGGDEADPTAETK